MHSTAFAQPMIEQPETDHSSVLTGASTSFTGKVLPESALSSLGGSGTQEDPYKLSSPDDYAVLHAAVNDGGIDCSGLYFEQTSDIVLPALGSGTWTPIGCRIDASDTSIRNGDNMRAFSGTLDGRGFMLTVPEGAGPLFGYVKGATIRNLIIYGKRIEGYGLIDNMEGYGLHGSAVVVDSVTIKAGTKTLKSGILGSTTTTSPYAGTSADYVSTIRNCTIEEGVEIGYDGTQSKIGSFAGRFNGTIEACVSAATVKGCDYVGGIVGSRDNAMGTYTVTDCMFEGEVKAEGENVGGIAGGNYDNSTAPNGIKPTIENCSVTGKVTGADNVGGILGGDRFGMQAWNDARIANNSFTGSVKAENGFYVGGIVGYYANLNKHDNFQNNCFKEGCGAADAFGAVVSVDTSCSAYAGTSAKPYGNDAATGAYYYNSAGASSSYTSTADGAIKDLLGIPKSGFKAITHQDENRTDDPLGVDAGVLAYSNATGQLENTCVSLRLSGSYKTDYAIGDAFSTAGMVVTGTWTDGTSRQIAVSDCVVTGFDANKVGSQNITVKYRYGAARYQVLVTNGASSSFKPNATGTVYLSVSNDARFAVSDGKDKGVTMWHVPIDLAEVVAWANSPAYDALGLQKYADFAPQGASYRYELTVMQLLAYANERYSSKGAAGLEFAGAAGSSYMKNGFFGHDDNLNYYVNGVCPTDANGSLGVTSERISLENGMYVDVAMFADRTFYEDQLAGFRYFMGASGKPIHAATAAVGAGTAFKVARIYEFTDGYKPETGCTVYWGTASDWNAWAAKGSAPSSKASGKATTKSNGTASITFPSVGTYYVWTAGGLGTAGTARAQSVVSTPSALKVVVSKGANPIVASAKAKAKIPAATYGAAKAITAAKVFTVGKAQGAVTYKKVSGNAKITVASNGKVTVKKGLKAGTYPLKVAITAAGNANYRAATKTVTAQIRVLRAANKAVPKKTIVSKTYSASKLGKQAANVALPKVTTKYGKAKWAVAKKDAKKVLVLKGSKVVVAKGAKKGTYALKLKAKVAKSANYNAATSKVVTVKVKVR